MTVMGYFGARPRAWARSIAEYASPFVRRLVHRSSRKLRCSRKIVFRYELGHEDPRLLEYLDASRLKLARPGKFSISNVSLIHPRVGPPRGTGRLSNWRLMETPWVEDGFPPILVGVSLGDPRPAPVPLRWSPATGEWRHWAEDLRLFSHGPRRVGLGWARVTERGTRLFLAHVNEDGGELILDDAYLLDESIAEPGVRFECQEKNWTPIPIDERSLGFVQDVPSGRILKLDLESRRLSLIDPGDPVRASGLAGLAGKIQGLRIASAPIPIVHRGKPGYLALGYQKNRGLRARVAHKVYATRFAILSSLVPFEFLAISDPVRFDITARNFVYPFELGWAAPGTESVYLSLNSDDAFQEIHYFELGALLAQCKW